MPPPAAPERILLIRLKSIGDIVLTLPAVLAVRANFPTAKITFLTSREHAPLLRGFREVDETIALDRSALKQGDPRKIAGALVPLLRQLRRGEFSLVIDFQGYGETELLAWWCGAAECWGTVYTTGRGWAYGRSFPRGRSHMAEENLGLLRQGGLPPGPVRNEYVVPEDALAAAREFFDVHRLESGRLTLYIQPFTSTPHKNWPLAKYLDVAEEWRQRGRQVVFGGGPADGAALAPARVAGFPVAAGTPLLVSAGLIKLASLVVGADTGLLHLAVAAGRRVLMIMDGNAPGTPHPFQHPDWTVIPEPGQSVAEIATSRVMTALERAVCELPGT